LVFDHNPAVLEFNVACKTDITLLADDVSSRESRLVAAAQDGDHSAFVELFQRYLPIVSRKIGRITKNQADTEDALQEALLRAYLNIGMFHGRSSFASWFTRIGINSALMLLRRRRSRPDMSADALARDNEAVRFDFPDSCLNPEEEYLQLEAKTLLRQATQQLRPSDRQILEMQYCGKSLQEIVAASGLSLAATKSRLFRGRKSVHDYFRRSFSGAEDSLPTKPHRAPVTNHGQRRPHAQESGLVQ
jgi:RNA polymerase sigma factor (sigma-70 family)